MQRNFSWLEWLMATFYFLPSSLFCCTCSVDHASFDIAINLHLINQAVTQFEYCVELEHGDPIVQPNSGDVVGEYDLACRFCYCCMVEFASMASTHSPGCRKPIVPVIVRKRKWHLMITAVPVTSSSRAARYLITTLVNSFFL